jgi:hypothetical protein
MTSQHSYEKVISQDDIESSFDGGADLKSTALETLDEDVDDVPHQELSSKVFNSTREMDNQWHKQDDDDSNSAMGQLRIIISLGWPNCIERFV